MSLSTDIALAAERENISPTISHTAKQPCEETSTDNCIIKPGYAEPVPIDNTEQVTKSRKQKSGFKPKIVKSGDFEAESHFYPRVLNAHIHPLVSSFFSLGNKRILARYTHLNPQVNAATLEKLLDYHPKYFKWAGSDLFNVTTSAGQRQMIIVETNSCPSGQKSMPLLSDMEEHGGYGIVIDSTFKELVSHIDPSLGDLAVVYDKNYMEASGYAAVLADATNEKVWLVEYYINDNDPPVIWKDHLMYIRNSENGCFF